MTAMVAGAVALAMGAREPQRGYRGFVDWSNDVTQWKVWSDEKAETFYYTGMQTSHGFQFNPHLFLGAGLGVEYCKKDGSYIVPLFLDVRTDQKFGKFTPFADLRIGCSMSEGFGEYVSPTIGYRFNWGRKVGINVGVGATIKGYHLEMYEMDPVMDSEGYWIMKYLGKEHRTRLSFAFRVGIDF